MSGSDELVRDYLDRLDRASAGLRAEHRAELLTEIEEHVRAARAEGFATGEAQVRTLLDRLGSPEDIAAAARADDGLPSSQEDVCARARAGGGSLVRPRGTGRELAAVLLLTVGSLVPVLGWLAGVALLWSSSLWRTREKVLGTLLVPFGPGSVLLAAGLLPFASSQVCSVGPDVSSMPVPPPPGVPDPLPPTGLAPSGSDSVTCVSSGGLGGWPVLLGGALLVVVPIVVAVLLYRRAATTPPEVVAPTAPTSPWGPWEVGGVIALALGGLLLPVAGSLAGYVLVSCSPRWTGRDKGVAAAVAVAPLLPALVSQLAGGAGWWYSPSAFGAGILVTYALLLLGPVLAATYLAVRLSTRRPDRTTTYGPTPSW